MHILKKNKCLEPLEQHSASNTMREIAHPDVRHGTASEPEKQNNKNKDAAKSDMKNMNDLSRYTNYGWSLKIHEC